MTSQKERDREEALTNLRAILKPGDTILTSVTHVARSGMSRSIKCYVVHKGELRQITYDVSRIVGSTIDRNNGGVKVGGCGMDMGFHVVYSVSRQLFRDGFRCAGRNCGSNDHFNGHRDEVTGERTPWPRDGRTKHRGDGGYALNQRWI